MNSLRLLSRNVQQAARSAAQARYFQSSSLLLTGQSHNATDETFKSLTSSKEPIIVDFHADWCGPCRLLDPIIRDAVEKSGVVTLIRVNVDDCPKISSEFQIASIPYVVALMDGQTVDKFVGALPKNAVKDFVVKHAARA